MKISLMFVLLTALQVNASVYSQNMKFTMKMKNTTVKEVFSQIEGSSEFRFFYNDGLLNLNERISINAKNQRVEEILDDMLEEKDLSYTVLDNNLIVITPCEAVKQQLTVKGVVKSATDGQPLPGVNVVEKGTTNGSVTDLDGNYSITVQGPNATLQFSFIGFLNEEIEVGGQSQVNVSLVEDIKELDEVVVIGYGTQKKRDITAAISSISEEAIERIPVASSVEAMKGQVAGVDVVQQGGRPGQYSSVTIRGRRSITASNDPLYVIDGIPMTAGSGTVFDFNSQDIESMEVLKDAAATAIYGSRGANGVILITTKRGNAGKTVVNYNGYYGISSVLNYPDMMNGEEFANMKRESQRDGWDGAIPPDDEIFEDPVELESIALGRTTDYPALVLGNGYQTNHQLSVAGGNEKTQFNISIGYYDEQGLIENQDYNRITARINIDHKIGKIFRVGMSSLASQSTQNWGSDATLGEAYANNPLGNPYDEEGNVRLLPTNDGIRTNPLSELVPGAYVDEREYTRIFNAAYLQANIVDGLTYRVNFGPDIRYRKQGVFRGSETNDNRGGPADAEYENNIDFGYTLENILTFEKDLGSNHSIKFTGLQSIQSQRYERHQTEVSNLPYESQLFYNLGSAEVKGNLISELSEWSLASFMGRLNYDLMGKYLFQASMRADGSSRLAEGNKWTYFPGLSFGWRLIDEPFMQNLSWLYELKLRGSYGAVGNTSIDPYQTQGALSRTTYAWGDAAYAYGYRLDGIPNPQLGWEKSTTIDVGADFGIIGNRVSGNIDYYITNTTDLLLKRNLPYTSGYENILQNVGATKTTGIELTLFTHIIDNPNSFKWDIDFNITHYKEEIIELALKDENGNPIDDLGNSWFIGEPIRVFYDYEKIGIWQANEVDLAASMENKVPGEIKLKDQDGDGVITPDDRIVLGSDVPDYYGGITNRFEYKGFDLSFFLYFKQGHMIRSDFHAGNNNLFGRYNNLDVDYWTIDNPTNDNPRPNENQEYPRDSDTRRYFDGSYIKLRNATLGYTLPSSITSKVGISNARIYVSGQNLWYTSEYETFDPENNNQLSSGDVPSARLVLGGINVTF